METTGRVVGTAVDILSGKVNVTVELNTKPMDDLREISDIPVLDVILKKHRNKRSLDANAYFHLLVGKIADKLKISKIRCKNILIARYGQQDFLDDGKPIILKTNIGVEQMLEQEMLHCLPCGNKIENGADVVFYKVYRGSHTYDSKEMSILIDGTVNEAKDLGIDTMPPDELIRLVEAWKGAR